MAIVIYNKIEFKVNCIKMVKDIYTDISYSTLWGNDILASSIASEYLKQKLRHTQRKWQIKISPLLELREYVELENVINRPYLLY